MSGVVVKQEDGGRSGSSNGSTSSDSSASTSASSSSAASSGPSLASSNLLFQTAALPLTSLPNMQQRPLGSAGANAASAAAPVPSSTVPSFSANPASASMQQQQQQPGASALTPPPMTRFYTLQGHPTPSAPSIPGSLLQRQVSRLPSASHAATMAGGNPSASALGNSTGGVGMVGFSSGDWRVSVAVEERISIRKKLRDAYRNHCANFETLLDTAVAIDEELLFAASHSRIDYFKASIDWDQRIQIKRQQLSSTNTNTTAQSSSNGVSGKKRSADDANLAQTASSLVTDPNADLFNPAIVPSAHTNASNLQVPTLAPLSAAAVTAPSSSSPSSSSPSPSPPATSTRSTRSSTAASASASGLPKSPSKDTAAAIMALGNAPMSHSKRHRGS